MDMQRLKNTVASIEMPEEIRQRILVKSKNRLRNLEEKRMKHTKKQVRWPAVMAAVLALCVCLPAAGMAMGNAGFFRDVMRGTAVVGTEYENATGEIAVDADFDHGELIVTANLLVPDAFPYRECEELAVGSYRIMIGDGKIVAEGEKSESASKINGQAVIRIPVEALNPGEYTLQIDAFIGSKKAEQPLPLKGLWECKLTIE